MEYLENNPKGFSFYGNHIGIKKKKKDFGLIVADTSCHAAAVFTKNTFCGECIPIGKEHIKNNELQAIVVTSGIANVATGEVGRANEFQLLEYLSKQLAIPTENILPSSTGVIGPQLPMDCITHFFENNIISLNQDHMAFAQAILTTDTCVKIRSTKIGSATILGIAKGSGMIEPNMATMLSYILTDAKIDKSLIYRLLKNAVDDSFNAISIDSDTSTSDTVALLASGYYEIDIQQFVDGLNKICRELALDIVKDAEGATKTIFVTVKNAQTKEQAKEAGKSIINSPLFKSAIFGHDPNWGRIAMALGKTPNLVFQQKDIIIQYGEFPIFSDNQEILENIATISEYIKNNDDIHLLVDLQQGNDSYQVIGCDLTYDYVKINSAYST